MCQCQHLASKPADVVNEVAQSFIQRTGVKVRITVEIEVESGAGFDDNLQRIAQENCGSLGFRSAAVEDEE